MEISIISIGNEVLKGHTSNSNYTFIARQSTLMGNHVRRGYTVSDDPAEISWALGDALSHSDLIITTGGLGPTYDDMTLESIAGALNLSLENNSDAMEMLRKRMLPRNIPLTQERMKMAVLPKGSEPVFNPVGSAPGVLITHNGRQILCLPGVPQEMEAIFNSIRERFQNSDLHYYEESLEFPGTMEGEMAPLIKEEMKKLGDRLYIKSHPLSGSGSGYSVMLEISSYNEDYSEARKLVKEELELFRKTFGKKDQ
ncbi:MAG: molybdopterin-binding protein [Thermoplasmataceae archaeon]|jgi:molybdenum cofactor synthesis domain-containing protein